MYRETFITLSTFVFLVRPIVHEWSAMDTKPEAKCRNLPMVDAPSEIAVVLLYICHFM